MIALLLPVQPVAVQGLAHGHLGQKTVQGRPTVDQELLFGITIKKRFHGGLHDAFRVDPGTQPLVQPLTSQGHQPMGIGLVDPAGGILVAAFEAVHQFQEGVIWVGRKKRIERIGVVWCVCHGKFLMPG